ncbi:S53 family peptidase [Streptacidiphilus jiangxiensis]|uniref:Pro-kumamolisin, activation domain n=1 Tax=Streptacidiphilus jiangxiensis TaxID=235985 RepID=A0A1H7X705_STRJI|nr:S53 family peptidase [Streptacidiphilus jiangxiensis]SEM29445.1 Pro-kumamolisin, activation domain [Streptacidiphilus jiangxiensis]
MNPEPTINTSRHSRATAAAIAALALTTSALTMAAQGQAAASAPSPAARALTGTHPAWATADRGALSAATRLTVRVYLAGQDPAGLAAYARAVSTPGSPRYGQYLTPAQVQHRYGPTAAQLTAVHGWLTGAGLSVTATTAHYVEVSGDAAALARAFGTAIHQYAVGGTIRHAPVGNAVLPASVASAVLAVSGLSSVTTHAHPQSVPLPRTEAGQRGTATAAAGGIRTTATCSAYWGQKKVTGAPAGYTPSTAYDECSFVPSQLRKAYGIAASGLTGKGARVAVVDAYASSTMLADANRFATRHGDKAFRPGQYTEVVNSAQWNSQDACGGPAGWSGEEALDVEMVHGLAPDANVVYVGANSCTDPDLLGALSTVVDQHLADVVSNSWGEIMHSAGGDMDPGLVAAYEQVFQQGAIEGIGFEFSAGDCGDDSPAAAATGVNCDPTTTRAQAQFPSSDPWVTSVGGTALGIKDAGGSYGFETDMGTLRSPLTADGTGWYPLPGAFYFGGGGGTSEDFAQPWYQQHAVPGSLAHTLMTGAHSGSARRVTPDVAMNGDLYTSVLVGMSDGAPYGEGGYGGTSVAAPEFSAVQADAIQARHGRPIGFGNPAIYLRANSKDFTDVVDQAAAHDRAPLNAVADFGVIAGRLHASLIAFGEDTSLNAVKGYDDATGVGSPTLAYLDSFR